MNRLLNEIGAAEYLAIDRKTLQNITEKGYISFVRIGRHTCYDRKDLDVFIDSLPREVVK